MDIIAAIIGMFEAAGCTSANSSRVGEYRRAFEDLKVASDSKKELTLESSEQLLQAVVNFEQLYVIQRAFVLSQDRAKWYPILQKIVSGHSFPLHARRPESSSGRDFQFEGFLAAIIQLSGIGCDFAEPDIVITDPEYPYRIAAKRPRDSAAIERNVKKATKQIRRIGGKGIIALDLSDALFHGRLLQAESSITAGNLAHRLVEKFWSEFRARIYKLTSHSNVIAILLNLHLPVKTVSSDGGPELSTTMKWQLVSLKPPATEQDADQLMRFTSICEAGLFGQ